MDVDLAEFERRMEAAVVNLLAKIEAQSTTVLDRVPSREDLRGVAVVLGDQRRRIEELEAENSKLRLTLDRFRTAETVDRGFGAAGERLRAAIEALEQRLAELPRRPSPPK